MIIGHRKTPVRGVFDRGESDILYILPYARITYRRTNGIVYVYVLDGIDTAVGGVGIGGSRSKGVLAWQSREGRETSTGFPQYCCKQF
jgi:hypothetical protein